MLRISAAKPKTDSLYIRSEILATLSGKALFYPCSGMDFKEPLAVFSPWIQDFYFVDKGYFCPCDQDMKGGSMGLRAYRLRPVLTGRTEYQLKEIRITGDVESDAWRVPEIDPITDSCWLVPLVLRTEIYVHMQTGRDVRLHFWRNDAVRALLSLANTIDLGVFFYRADSMGEGGSGVMWMQHRLISQVLSQLADQGLLVTDGSQHDGLGRAQDRGPALAYRDLWRHREQGGRRTDSHRMWRFIYRR